MNEEQFERMMGLLGHLQNDINRIASAIEHNTGDEGWKLNRD